MAYVLLYGNGWTQRWQIAQGAEKQVHDGVTRVGTNGTGRLTVIDPGSGEEATLMVAWGLVAAAVVLDGSADEGHDDSGGQYR